MENKCCKCGGKTVTGYLMAGTWLAEFIPQCDEKKLIRRHLKVLCDTCVECGNIENIRIEQPEKLKQIFNKKERSKNGILRYFDCFIFACDYSRSKAAKANSGNRTHSEQKKTKQGD